VNVLFVALGATRRPAVARESARVVAGGGSATVLVRKPSTWARDRLADGVDMVELPELERAYRPSAARALLRRIRRPRDRRDPAAVRRRTAVRELLRDRSIDLVVVADPHSLVTVSELADVIAGAGARPAYSVARAVPPARSGGE
jgi:hypothetical protein